MTEFIEFLGFSSRLYGIRLIAYCLMTNHYHLLLQNSSGRLSEFMKHLNSRWARKFRNSEGGKGYLFESRFKSTLVEEEDYLEAVFCYILLNPVRAGITDDPWKYPFSSIRDYYRKGSSCVDPGFVRCLYPLKSDLNDALASYEGKIVKQTKTRIGPVIGSAEFIKKSIDRFERRRASAGGRRRRIAERSDGQIQDLIRRFEIAENVRIDRIDVTTLPGKRLRARLLVVLRDVGGLPYSEINKIPLYRDLKYFSLSNLYVRTRERTATCNRSMLRPRATGDWD
jgi:REP element-mobilizing transposase RayT